MSSYLGGFPPSVPRRIIDNWVPPRTTVLDPFCGSGTTLLEARLSGRPSIGIDLNPLAVALAQAKAQSVTLDDALHRLADLARSFPGDSALEAVPEPLTVIFHERTLAQLCYLKQALNADLPEDLFIRGCLLGIMHGKHRRGGGTAYLSIDMPNTFSMSPEYVRRFVHTNGLTRPPVDAFAKLRERMRWLLRDGALPPRPSTSVFQGDAVRLPEILEIAGIRSVGAIVTSPPYLGILRYGAFNWIRLWFLGFTQFQIDRLLDGTDSLDIYLSFVSSFLASAARVVRTDGILALVIGDVIEAGQHVPLAVRLWDELGDLVPFELIEISKDDYDATSKTTRIWGDARKGRATPRDRILVLRRTTRKPKARRPTRR
jgi:site-specific DNA-methyltransferase (adenine-specific)